MSCWVSKGLVINPGAKLNSLEFEAPVRIGKIKAKKITVGAWSYIQSGCSFFSEIIIGRYCSIAENLLTSLPEHPTDWLGSSTVFYQRTQFDNWLTPGISLRAKNKSHERIGKVTIGNDVWIGRNVIIMDGIIVGDGAVIAAGAVVTKDVKPYSIIGGVPARLIRMRFDPVLIKKLTALEWWKYDRNDLLDITFENPCKAIKEISYMLSSGNLKSRDIAYVSYFHN